MEKLNELLASFNEFKLTQQQTNSKVSRSWLPSLNKFQKDAVAVAGKDETTQPVGKKLKYQFHHKDNEKQCLVIDSFNDLHINQMPEF